MRSMNGRMDQAINTHIGRVYIFSLFIAKNPSWDLYFIDIMIAKNRIIMWPLYQGLCEKLNLIIDSGL